MWPYKTSLGLPLRVTYAFTYCEGSTRRQKRRGRGHPRLWPIPWCPQHGGWPKLGVRNSTQDSDTEPEHAGHHSLLSQAQELQAGLKAKGPGLDQALEPRMCAQQQL